MEEPRHPLSLTALIFELEIVSEFRCQFVPPGKFQAQEAQGLRSSLCGMTSVTLAQFSPVREALLTSLELLLS